MHYGILFIPPLQRERNRSQLARLPALNSLIYYCSAIFANFVFEVVQGSTRALYIKKTRKTGGGLISGGSL